MIDSKVSTKGHKLLDLYKKIKLTTRKQVEEVYQKKDSRVSKDLPAYRIVINNYSRERTEKGTSVTSIEELLRIHSESFENWRYLYEFGEDGSRNDFDFKAMDNFYNALREILTEKMKNRPPKFAMKKA